MSANARLTAIRELYESVGQGHVLKFFEALKPPEQVKLLDQLEQIDVKRLVDTYKLTVAATSGSAAPARPAPLQRVEKLFKASDSDRIKWQNRGLSMIGQGAVAFLLLAGGQGTRLGTLDPKGCYDIGLPSRKSLFQLMAERLRTVAELSKGVFYDGCTEPAVPFYVMTSPQTDEATQSFFKQNKYFGLDERNVFFFQQGTLPCLSMEGQILLETPCTVTSAPDGNGGIYVALEKSGALADMRKRGVEVVHCSSVDNALVLAADPLFVGYCVELGADCGAKVCAKACPEEAVGVLCAEEGGAKVVEYSELDPAAAKEMDPATGELRLNAGNICNHFYTLDFLQKAATLPTPFHVAKKKIPCLDESGVTANTVTPAANNGVKLEMFIFDCFPHSNKFACAEVLREHEFGPVKNAPGSSVDSPDTARALLLELGRSRALAAGATVSGDGGIEICTLLTYTGEGLGFLKGTQIDSSLKIPLLIDHTFKSLLVDDVSPEYC